VTWNFPESLHDYVQRVEAGLRNPPSFAHITRSIKEEMEVLCAHEQACDVFNGFSRIVYCIKVPQRLFDLFFNSRNSYRAAYFRSAYDGLKLNSYFIKSLLPVLLEANPTKSINKGKKFIKESLKSIFAKVWLAEKEKHLCEKCSGEWGPPQVQEAEILNERWEKAVHANANYGKMAPYPLTKLRLFGAFLNDRYDELIPVEKRFRANDIHKHGWT